MTTDALPAIVAEITIAAPIDHVWHILTSPETVPGWLGCMNYQPTIGHTFYMQQDAGRRSAGNIAGATHCDVERLEPPDLFTFC